MEKNKKDNKQNINVGFSFTSIITKQFAIIPENYKVNNKNTYSTITNFGLYAEQKIVEVVLEIKLKQSKGVFMICQVACCFSIEQEAWEKFLIADNNEIAFPQNFMTHLIVLTVGVIRGFLHAKTENTSINGFVLPTLNVTTIVKDEVVFTL